MEERCKHKDNTAMYYQRRNRSTRRKTSPPPSKRLIIHQRMKLGYMNSRRPSKLNLLSAPKPSKLLALTGLRQILSSLTYRIPQQPIASTKMNWSLLNCFPSNEIPPHRYGYGEIRICLNVSLKDMSMERVRVEKFGESNDENCG